MSTETLPLTARRWVPWDASPTRADLYCWYAIAAMAVYYMAIWPFRPFLIGTNALLLAMLTGAKEAVIAAGAFAATGSYPLVLAVLAASIGMIKFDPVQWWAGRLWGPAIIGKFARRSRSAAWFAARAEGLSPWLMMPAVALAPWTPFPSSLVYAAAGWTGMRLRTFLLVDGIGTVIRSVVYAGLGYAIGQPAVDIAEAISANGIWVSLGIVLIAVLVQMWRRRRSPT
ncbi:DedA family protein [Pseudonocardia sp. TRM90224]|uniref:DedA family protein n=1 Tax=Pseudonocardia sp. TRM90224 TaxID=2812678 RepID=UPI001E627590|nr:VTT domain-containing protein [Pseudonocardia sp. TRM90224]